MLGQILQTKLYRPRPRPNTVARQRLHRRLDEGLSLGRKLTLVAAAAGYGKTTLVSEWLAEQERPVAWLSLDMADNDPVRFLAHVIAALQTIDADFGIDLMVLLEVSKPLVPGIVVPVLLNEIIGQLPQFILVLDDYYLIETPSVHEIMTLLIEQMSPAMHLILITRVDPPLPLARLRANGQLTEVRARELYFTQEETASFLNECMGLDLTKNDVAVLENRTEGWIAGLQLAALSLRGATNIGEFIESFAGNNRYVHDYLLEEVLAQQPKAVQDFLIQTSILERLNGSLCNAVTGQSDGQIVLERLDTANLFVIPLDNQRNWYRYHQLFMDILRIRLQADWPDKVDEMHVRASKWYEAHHFTAEAIQHALAARAWDRAADLMERAVPRLGRTKGDISPLLAWCQQLPEEIVASRPVLAVYYTWLLTDTAQLEAAEHWLHRLESGSVADLEKFGSISATIRSQIALIRGHGADAVAQAEQALARMPADEQTFWREMAVLSLMSGALSLGDLQRAEDAARTLPSLDTRPTATHLFAASLSGIIQVVRGEYHAAARHFRHILDHAVLGERGSRRPSPLHPMAGLAQIGLGQVLLAWNLVEEAAPLIESGLRLGEQTQNTTTLTHAYEALLDLRWTQTDLPGFDEALQRTGDWEETLKTGGIWLANVVTAYRRCFEAVAGKMDGLTIWLASFRVQRTASVDLARTELSYAEMFMDLAFARGLLAWGESSGDPILLDESATVLRNLVANSRSQTLFTIQLRAQLYLALVLRALGQLDEGILAMERAVDLASPAAALRPFLDEGGAACHLLRTLSDRPHPPAFTRVLVDAFAETAAPIPAVPASPTGQDTQQANQQLLDPLTERELDVLQHIAKGLTNKEIADHLYVTEGTVKSHAKHIYSKLGVGNRTEAAARARELHLV